LWENAFYNHEKRLCIPNLEGEKFLSAGRGTKKKTKNQTFNHKKGRIFQRTDFLQEGEEKGQKERGEDLISSAGGEKKKRMLVP